MLVWFDLNFNCIQRQLAQKFLVKRLNATIKNCATNWFTWLSNFTWSEKFAFLMACVTWPFDKPSQVHFGLPFSHSKQPRMTGRNKKKRLSALHQGWTGFQSSTVYDAAFRHVKLIRTHFTFFQMPRSSSTALETKERVRRSLNIEHERKASWW